MHGRDGRTLCDRTWLGRDDAARIELAVHDRRAPGADDAATTAGAVGRIRVSCRRSSALAAPRRVSRRRVVRGTTAIRSSPRSRGCRLANGDRLAVSCRSGPHRCSRGMGRRPSTISSTAVSSAASATLVSSSRAMCHARASASRPTVERSRAWVPGSMNDPGRGGLGWAAGERRSTASGER